MTVKKMILVILTITIIFFSGCSSKSDGSLDLKLALTIQGDIDTKDSTRTFSEIEDMDFDSQGNIYLLNSRKGKILKFNEVGEFITSFGDIGKEPGQFLSLDFAVIDDDIYVKSFPIKKIVKFDNQGKYLESFDYTNEGMFKGVIGEILRSVSKDKIVGYINFVKETPNGQLLFRHNLALMNKKFEKLAVLRDYETEFDPANIRYFESVSKYTNGDGKIYVAENSQDDYKINVFDLDGKKLKQITHDYKKLEYNGYEREKIRTLNLRANGNLMSENKSYKKSINDLFYDKYGRLLVCSSIERNSRNQNDFIVDIFKDGTFISTTKVNGLIGEDFVRRFDSKIYFFGDKIYEIVNSKSEINIYGY